MRSRSPCVMSYAGRNVGAAPIWAEAPFPSPDAFLCCTPHSSQSSASSWRFTASAVSLSVRMPFEDAPGIWIGGTVDGAEDVHEGLSELGEAPLHDANRGRACLLHPEAHDTPALVGRLGVAAFRQ